MKIKNKRVKLFSVIAIAITLFLTTNVFAYESWEYIGWVNNGPPTYTWSTVDSSDRLTSYTPLLNKQDVSGGTIMSRLKKSYTLRNRASKIRNAQYMQRKLWADELYAEDRSYTSKTYYPSPYGMGYTEWYDSPSGVFLDYAHQYARWKEEKDKANDNDKDVGVDVVRDSIYYNRVQYPGQQPRAFIATNNSGLADAKTGAIMQRNGKNYPIYLNNSTVLDSNVRAELKSKRVKDLYFIGGNACFDYTAGITEGFNIIRLGGLNREHTKDLMLKMPSSVEQPRHYQSDENGYVLEGVPADYQNIIKDYLYKEKSSKDGKNLVQCVKYFSKFLNIGTEPNEYSSPCMVIGINDGAYEAYWICYWNKPGTGYVYQFILGGYYDQVKINTELTSVETSDTVYKQNNNVYWTALNKDININTRGTTNVKYNMEAIQLNLKDSTTDAKHIMTPSNVNTSNFSDFTNATRSRAVLGKYNGLNSITGRHTLKAKENNKEYALYTAGQLGNWSEYIYSGIQLKTDGEAPTVTGIPSGDFREAPFEFTLKATDSLSGVKNIKLIKDGKEQVSKSSITTTITEEGENKFTVKATDNVGNIYTKDFVVNIDLGLTIEGKINPNPTPSGKKLTINVGTTGKANKIKVVFPDEIRNLTEEQLIFERDVVVEPKHEEIVYAWLPLETPKTLDSNGIRIKPPYKVYIEAENIYGKVEGKYIDLDVQGSILDNLKYGIKATGYDRE